MHDMIAKILSGKNNSQINITLSSLSDNDLLVIFTNKLSRAQWYFTGAHENKNDKALFIHNTPVHTG